MGSEEAPAAAPPPQGKRPRRDLSLGAATAAILGSLLAVGSVSAWANKVEDAQAILSAAAADPGAKPPPLILTAAHPQDFPLRGHGSHRSHVSHKSHASHASHYSGTGGSLPPPPAPPPAAPTPPPSTGGSAGGVPPATPPATDPVPAEDLLTVLGATGRCTTFLSAIHAAGIADVFKGQGPLTVLAPTDDAFVRLPPAVLLDLLKPENRARLSALLRGHVVSGVLKATALAGKTSVATLSGAKGVLASKDGAIAFNGAVATRVDVPARNGVVHLVDAVSVPAEGDILKTLGNAGTFKTFLTLVQATDLAVMLAGADFTVLAPTDDAFASLPAGTLRRWLSEEGRAELRPVLLRHVVAGRVFAQPALWRRTLLTADGSQVSVSGDRHAPLFGDAKASRPDWIAQNGVIHALDAVRTVAGSGR